MRTFDETRFAGNPLSAGGYIPAAHPPGPPTAPEPSHLSPSLRKSGSEPAFEIKFLLPEDLARAVERRAAGGMALDPHTDPALGSAYRTTTLYCDTPGFDVFHGTGPGRGRKHRVRRYGLAPWAFVERKTKRGPQVRKRRSAVALDQLPALSAAPGGDPGWAGEWFRRRLARYALRPVCRVSYERTAYSGATAEGPLRLTFDRRLRSRPAVGWDVTAVLDGPDLLDGLVVVEFKFQGVLPSAGKRVIEELQLQPGSASKYKRALAGAGLAPSASAPDNLPKGG